MELDAAGGLLYDSSKTYCIECSEPIDEEALIYCDECEAPIHKDCAQESYINTNQLCNPCLDEEEERLNEEK